MSSVCFYFQVHQPLRIKRFRFFDIGSDQNYFDDDSESNLNNEKVFRKVSEKCYLPTNALLLKLLGRHSEFKITYSFSGVFLDQAKRYYPEVLDSFKRLYDTGRVEILSETFYHSLAFLYSKKEFTHQVKMHQEIIKDIFGIKPEIFRNTELIYSDDIAKEVYKMGYKGLLAEGTEKILEWRSENYLYHPPATKKLKILLRNYKLSDDIAFRFSDPSWVERPLTVDKFVIWLNEALQDKDIVNLFMDYETFGEHQWEDTGIYDFLKKIPEKIINDTDIQFVTPKEAIKKYRVKAELEVKDYISWADIERDLSAWLANEMQREALDKMQKLGKKVLKAEDEKLINDWRLLQTSDHYYYMCTKWFADGDVHKYFNPYDSPYDAFISFMNVLNDVELKLRLKENVNAA
jgi:alpha-amylase